MAFFLIKLICRNDTLVKVSNLDKGYIFFAVKE